jgi:23S rRNA (cytidine1920-2'-O)/16S rRNA (cytidine1409-2'-O)-methyltransferase
MSQRISLDNLLLQRCLVESRSQAVNWVKSGKVKVNGKILSQPRAQVESDSVIDLDIDESFVSRAGLKLSSAVKVFKLDFNEKNVLDVGSSTGGFTDFALQNGAKKVIAVDIGSNQLHPKLRVNPRVELHEQTDIREIKSIDITIDIIVIDVSFISLKKILPHLKSIAGKQTDILAMVKPQFESENTSDLNSGIIKNEKIRRAILKEFESWAKNHFYIIGKADSGIAGKNGNLERFYLLKKLKDRQ